MACLVYLQTKQLAMPTKDMTSNVENVTERKTSMPRERPWDNSERGIQLDQSDSLHVSRIDVSGNSALVHRSVRLE